MAEFRFPGSVTGGDYQVLRRETGKTYAQLAADGDEIQIAQWLVVTGKKRLGEKDFSWPMTLSMTVDDYDAFVTEHWDFTPASTADDDTGAEATVPKA